MTFAVFYYFEALLLLTAKCVEIYVYDNTGVNNCETITGCHIISCHYTSSQAEFSFRHLAFVLLDDLMELLRILTLNKGLYFKICQFFYVRCHIMEQVTI